MAFKPFVNGFVADSANRRLRARHGYIKMRDIGKTGRPGYLRSVEMTAKKANVSTLLVRLQTLPVASVQTTTNQWNQFDRVHLQTVRFR